MPFLSYITVLAKCFVSLMMYSFIPAEELRAHLTVDVMYIVTCEMSKETIFFSPGMISFSLFTNVTHSQGEGITIISLSLCWVT